MVGTAEVSCEAFPLHPKRVVMARKGERPGRVYSSTEEREICEIHVSAQSPTALLSRRTYNERADDRHPEHRPGNRTYAPPPFRRIARSTVRKGQGAGRTCR